MRKTVTTLLLALTLALAGCGTKAPATPTPAPTPGEQPGEQTATRSFETELGPLELAYVPQRIVALNLQAIDSLVVLGVEPVGIALPGGEYPVYLPEVGKIESVGSHSSPSIEKIAALKPDLIILDPELQKEMVEPMQQIAPVLGIRGRHWQETLTDLQLLGDIVEKRAEADAFATKFDNQLKETQAKTKEAPKLTVLGLYGAPDKFLVWTAKSYIGSLLEEGFGLVYLYKGSESDEYSDNASISMEKVLSFNPDALFLFSGKEKLSAAWQNDRLYGQLSAVQNGRIFEMERNTWSRSRGPIAATLILEQAGQALYPDLFAAQ